MCVRCHLCNISCQVLPLKLLSDGLFFVALELKSFGAAACPVPQCTGGMEWVDMLFSGHSQGHIYLFYGAKLTGALNNIPDACCTAFYQPDANRQQQKGCDPLCLSVT